MRVARFARLASLAAAVTSVADTARGERIVAFYTDPSLQPHEKKNLATEAVEITKHHLAGGWVYTSGAKPKADDALGGLWVRVMQGGQQFSEYANPSTLLKEKWE